MRLLLFVIPYLISHQSEFFIRETSLCQPVCQQLSQEKIRIKEIQYVRNKRRRQLKEQIFERKSLVEAVIEANKKI